MNCCSLAEIKENEGCVIRALGCDETLKSRLLDLGVIRGTFIKCVNTAMGGTPIAFDIRGTVIALRKSDCEGIEVSPENDNHKE